MSRDTILTDGDGKKYSFDNLGTQHWLEGHVPGMDRAVAYLKAKAVDLFREGKDAEAVELRQLADQLKAEIGPELHRAIAEHRRDYPIEIRSK